MDPTKPPCPRCGLSGVEAWTYFNHLQFTCNQCAWTATVPSDDRDGAATWHSLIARAAARLRDRYGLTTDPATLADWQGHTPPMWGWDLAADRLCAAAMQAATPPPPVSVTAWARARIDAEAAEWAELRGWLWTAFAPFAAEAAA